MKKTMRNIKCFLLALILAISGLASSQENPINSIADSPQTEASGTSQEARDFDELKINKFRSDSEFQYNIDHSQKKNLWDRILAWLTEFILELFYRGGNSMLGKFIFYGIMISAIVYTILKLLKANPVGFLVKSTDRLDYNVTGEDIHSISFDEQITTALEAKNYKLAIRLYYLFALKNLTDREIIQWKPGKANQEYVYEIRKGKLRTSFVELSI